MGRRYNLDRTPNYYVQRDRKGRFKKWTEVMPRGVSIDESRQAKRKLPKSKPGYGHQADYTNGGKNGHASPGTGKGIPVGKKKQVRIPIEKGKLSRFGYSTKKSYRARHAALNKAVNAYGALSVYRKLNAQVILRKNRQPKARKIFEEDRDWVREQFKVDGFI